MTKSLRETRKERNNVFYTLTNDLAVRARIITHRPTIVKQVSDIGRFYGQYAFLRIYNFVICTFCKT